MTARELAEELLKNPDMLIMINDGIGPRLAGRPYKTVITNDNSMDIADCEDLVGQEVLVINAWG